MEKKRREYVEERRRGRRDRQKDEDFGGRENKRNVLLNWIFFTHRVFEDQLNINILIFSVSVSVGKV